MSETQTTIYEQLERGQIATFDPCPFALPTGDDLAFLLQQQLQGAIHKNISCNPETGQVAGFVRQSDEQTERLQRLLSDFSRNATTWLAEQLPSYASAWQLDRVTLRTEEEATRKLRLSARNDLLHFDAFPSRPSQGNRILRLYVNINPVDDRVWVVSESFAKVFEKLGAKVGLPNDGSGTWVKRIGQGLIGLFQPTSRERTEYDDFMLRLHHVMKNSNSYQEQAPKRLQHFRPGSAWLLFSDGLSHAELRGQYALEHSYFVATSTLALPDEAPSAIAMRQHAGVQANAA